MYEAWLIELPFVDYAKDHSGKLDSADIKVGNWIMTGRYVDIEGKMQPIKVGPARVREIKVCLKSRPIEIIVMFYYPL